MHVFFFNDTATTEIYTLSLHDALPILLGHGGEQAAAVLRALRCKGAAGARAHVDDVVALALERREAAARARVRQRGPLLRRDRKSTRLNSSHANNSYAVFCLKKKTSCN